MRHVADCIGEVSIEGVLERVDDVVTVYRIEAPCRTGGPYWKLDVPHKFRQHTDHHPSPSEDCVLKRNRFHSHFCFMSLQDARNWFQGELLEFCVEGDCVLVEYEVSEEYLRIGKKQAMFLKCAKAREKSVKKLTLDF